MKKLASTLAISLVLYSFASADGLKTDPMNGQDTLKTDQMNAQDMLKTRLDAVFGVLANSELKLEEKDERILKIVTPIFDFRLMAFLTLGRPQWSSLDKEEEKQFTDLFVKHVKNSYRDKITLYTDQKVVFKPATIKKTRAVVPSELVSKDSSLSIIYKLRKQKEKPWRVYDIEIQGVSVVITYQSQFKEILQSGSFEDLLKQLAETADKDAPKQ